MSGRSWPVELRYRPLSGEDEDQKERDRGQAILDAVDELAAEGAGDVLVFLPGERAIRETSELLRKHHPPDTEILPLYARLSAAQQNRIFRPHRNRRIVLATNVAETSLTVPGIRYVVDTGLARLGRYNYRTKVQRLPIEAVSQASANQRAGRCGRVSSGICIRLYSEEDYLARAEFTEPEIQRTNLAAVILQMEALGLGSIEAFPFVDPPDLRFIRDGYKLLHELGAVDEQQRILEVGRVPHRAARERVRAAVRTTHDRDVIDAMANAMSTLGLYIVLVFFAAQFVKFFSWTNLGAVTAVTGATFLENVGFTGPAIFFFFILICAFINLMLGSASAQWAVTAPIFVPMLMLIGYSPEVIQAAYRIGDSSTNIITPMMSYFGLIMAFAAKYVPKAGVGTLIAMMLPYCVAYIVLWSLFFFVWVFVLGLPVGPAAPTYYMVGS